MTADTILHICTPTTLRQQLLMIFRHSYVINTLTKLKLTVILQ